MQRPVVSHKSNWRLAKSISLKAAFWLAAISAIYSYQVDRPGRAFGLAVVAVVLLVGDFFRAYKSTRWEYAQKVGDADHPPKPKQ